MSRRVTLAALFTAATTTSTATTGRTSTSTTGRLTARFEELGSFFRVTLYNKKPVERGEINERQKHALAYLSKNPSITSKTYMKLNSVSHPIAVLDLNKLCNLGKIKRIGKTRGTYYIPIK